MCNTDRAEDAHGLLSGLGCWPLLPELAYGHLESLIVDSASADHAKSEQIMREPTKHYVVAGAFRRMPNNVNSSAAPAVTVKSTNPMV
jgi:hypothetical protein